VILNLALWFALHTLFARTLPVAWGPVGFEIPAVATLNWPALILTTTAALAIFRFRAGALWTLGACAIVGLGWGLATTGI